MALNLSTTSWKMAKKTMPVLAVFENRQPGISPGSAMMDSTGHSRPNDLAIIKEE